METIREQEQKQLDELRSEISKLDRKIRDSKEKRSRMASERDRLVKRLSEIRTGPKKSDNLFVKCIDIKVYILEWIEEWNSVYGYGGQAQLSREANVSPKTIRGITNNDQSYCFVSWRLADKLMTHIQRQDIMSDIELYDHSQVHWRRKPAEPPVSKYYEE